MNTEAIIATLLSTAAFLKKPFCDAATQTVKDLFDAIRYYLHKKFGKDSDGAKVLDLATQKPESAMRKAVLMEEIVSAGLDSDAELLLLAEQLASALPSSVESQGQHVQVGGRGNKVTVAGRDVIHAERVIHRTAITPDERHITPEQRKQLHGVIGELAVRLANDDGKPNFAAGHRMLQCRFGIASCVLLPREKFDEAMAFLKEQRAAHRARLRARNPSAYASDLYRAVFSRAGELGWERQKVYAFASEKLGLKKPIMSLKELGPNQLRSLVAFMQRKDVALAAW